MIHEQDLKDLIVFSFLFGHSPTRIRQDSRTYKIHTNPLMKLTRVHTYDSSEFCAENGGYLCYFSIR